MSRHLQGIVRPFFLLTKTIQQYEKRINNSSYAGRHIVDVGCQQN